MTIAIERTMAVIRARKFLLELSVAPDDIDLELVRVRARMLLRHFPEPVDLYVSAAYLPDIWAEPSKS